MRIICAVFILWTVAVIVLSATTIVVLGLASVMFLSALVLTVALMLRSRWDKMSTSDPHNQKD